MFINIKKIVIISACALVLTGCQTNAENSSVSSSIDTNISDSISSTSEESSIAQTTEETTTKPVETPKPVESEAPETTVASTTKAPETTSTTAVTTKAPEWTEEKLEATKYIAETCYSRNKAIIGAEAVKQYMMGDSIKVIAKTNTGYFKLKDGEFIHGDYLSDTKVEVSEQPTNASNAIASSTTKSTNSTPNNTDYGTTTSGDKILGYTGDGNAIIGYTPDGDAYIAEGSDEYGEYWVTAWAPDGSPIIIYKDPYADYDDTSMPPIEWEY